jgi:hypothetical protein
MTVARMYRTVVPKQIRGWIRRNLLIEQFQEIHIERIEYTHRKLWKWTKKHPEAILMPTFSTKEPSFETLELYKKLIMSFKNPVGLHVHISNGLYYSPPPPLPNYEGQLQVISRGLEHLRKLGVSTVDFASGNWNYNTDTFLVCKKLGLVRIHIKLGEISRITCEYGIPEGICLIPVWRHIHDYDI